jgi:hypothetical protein
VVDENKIDEDEAVRGCLNVEALFRFLNARGFTMRPSPTAFGSESSRDQNAKAVFRGRSVRRLSPLSSHLERKTTQPAGKGSRAASMISSSRPAVIKVA